MRLYIVAATVLSIAACATSDPELPNSLTSNDNSATSSDSSMDEGQAEAVVDSSEIVCRRERKPGSNLKIRICRTRAQMELEKEAADRALRDRDFGAIDAGIRSK